MAHRWFIEKGRLCLAAMLLALTAVLAFGSLTAEAAKPRVAIVGFTSRDGRCAAIVLEEEPEDRQ